MKNVLEKLRQECGGDSVKMLEMVGRIMIHCLHLEQKHSARIVHKGHGRLIVRLSDNTADMSSARWTSAEDDFLLRSAASIPPDQLALATGRTEEAVRVRASKLGIRLLRKHVPLDEQYLRDNAGKKTLQKMAEHFGVGINSIAREMNRLGLDARVTSNKWDDAQWHQVQAMVAEGRPFSQIGARFGISEAAAYTRYRRRSHDHK